MTPSGSRPRVPSPSESPRVAIEEASRSPSGARSSTASGGPITSGTPAAASPSSGTAPSPPWSRSAVNPYLASDPNLKARRLARVLVSDMVVYHPDKREEGLRTGSLKQLFREEIKKSYEEYVDQVGKDFAESTQHFQEALNEILAGGKRVF
jgi:hypothetical protein